MTEGRLKDLEIRRAQHERDTDHLVVDIGSARAHISLTEEKACVTVHDSDTQASIVLDSDEDVTTVAHEEGISVVDRTDGILDPMAVTSK